MAVAQKSSGNVQSVANLEKAYLGETTACSKYQAYAAKAKKDGLASVASLFSAASQAEAIHARNHAAALAKLGQASPAPGSFDGVPGPTKVNLKDAWSGETQEKDQMYPGMIATAKTEKQTGATQTFQYALAAEKQHAALYAEALSRLMGGKKDPAARTYFVCQGCGATTAKAHAKQCPICGGKGFDKVP